MTKIKKDRTVWLLTKKGDGWLKGKYVGDKVMLNGQQKHLVEISYIDTVDRKRIRVTEPK
jgi:hypothetical protein